MKRENTKKISEKERNYYRHRKGNGLKEKDENRENTGKERDREKELMMGRKI